MKAGFCGGRAHGHHQKWAKSQVNQSEDKSHEEGDLAFEHHHYLHRRRGAWASRHRYHGCGRGLLGGPEAIPIPERFKPLVMQLEQKDFGKTECHKWRLYRLLHRFEGDVSLVKAFLIGRQVCREEMGAHRRHPWEHSTASGVALYHGSGRFRRQRHHSHGEGCHSNAKCGMRQ